MKFSDLVERLGVPARQVRYMISEGLVPEASETGRNADAWDEGHVAAGIRALGLQSRGFAPSAVKILMAGGTPVPVADLSGIVLSIDPALDPAAIDVDAALEAIGSALRAYVSRPASPAPATEE